MGQIPVAVSVHPSRRFAYVVNGGVHTLAAIDPNSISVYAARSRRPGPSPGPSSRRRPPPTLRPESPSPRSSIPPASSSTSSTTIASVARDDTDLSVFTIDSTDGTLSAPTRTGDSGGAPPTAVALSTGGHFAYVTYMHRPSTPVGNTFFETVKTFAVNPVTGELSGPIGEAATGTAPWAIVVDPNDRFAFVASLSSDEVQTYALD